MIKFLKSLFTKTEQNEAVKVRYRNVTTGKYCSYSFAKNHPKNVRKECYPIH